MPEEICVSVVVPSHGRHLRLLWLLNALADQTLGLRWELVVVHDYDAATAARVFDDHPLARDGILRHIAIGPGTGAAEKRNAGWRTARAPLVAFTDDDCRPEPDWLEHLVSAWRPGAVVQGATRPEPFESQVLRAPHVRTVSITPVNLYLETCNILYPRDLLERAGGFDERAPVGEDVALALQAEAAGGTFVPAPDAIVNHAVESHTLPGIVRHNRKWRHLAYLAKHYPEVRRIFPLRVFWDEEHLWTAAAMAGVAGALRYRPLVALAAPYVVRGARRRGRGPRGRIVALAELPGQAVRQVAEVVGLAAASVRHRTVVL